MALEKPTIEKVITFLRVIHHARADWDITQQEALIMGVLAAETRPMLQPGLSELEIKEGVDLYCRAVSALVGLGGL